jgi:hypothetical protein
MDISSATHNTCTFTVSASSAARPEDVSDARTLQQHTTLRRSVDANAQPEPPVDRGGRHLLDAHAGPLRVVGSEAAALYGAPIETFARFFILCGEHALFIVDHIVSSEPVRTTWNWLLNNRDGALDVRPFPPDRLVARRGDAGLKLFHLGEGRFSGPVYAHVHDAYHPLPGQPSEGKPGSGLLFRWTERAPQTVRTVIHAIPVDHYGAIGYWHLRTFDDGRVGLEAPDGADLWTVALSGDPFDAITVTGAGRQYRIAQSGGHWSLTGESES